MLHARLVHGDLRFDIAYAEGTEHRNQDRWIVHPVDSEVVRVGVIDGVTPWRCKEVPAGDAGAYAASMAAAALSLDWPMADALAHVNRVLHDPDLAPSQRQVMTSLIALECRRVGSGIAYDATVSADCELWIAETPDAPLSLALGGDFLRPDARTAIAAQWNGHPEWNRDERLALMAQILEDPSTQVRHALGRYARPHLETTSGSAGILVLASDGARIAEGAQKEIRAKDVPQWCIDEAQRVPRDDITCAIVSPAL